MKRSLPPNESLLPLGIVLWLTLATSTVFMAVLNPRADPPGRVIILEEELRTG